MADSTKRPFGSIAGGSTSGSAVKKAKPSPSSTTPAPSAFSMLMASASSKSKLATVFDPLNPSVIRLSSAPSLEHWLWLDPFANGPSSAKPAGEDVAVNDLANAARKTGQTALVKEDEITDLDDEIQFISQSQPQAHIHTSPNAEAGPSTLPAPSPSPSKHLPDSNSNPNQTINSIATTNSKSENGSKLRIKLALFDLDGTLIRTRSNAVMPRDASDWEWLYGGDGESGVKRGLRRCWEEGYHLIIISNQNISSTPPKNKPNGSSALDNWREKVGQICSKLPPNIPLRIMAATQKDQYRKPRIGMFEELETLYKERGMEIDIHNSYYVGDAAGRLPSGGRKGDHNDTDRKFALNAGLRFYTPEEYFGQSLADPKLPHPRGFDARAYMQAMEFVPEVTPTTTPVIPKVTREIVMFVGSPAAGKTTFFNRNFKPKGYVHVNQDTLKSRDKCLARVEEVIKGGKGGCVVDNTNRDKRTRKLYVDLAKTAGVPIRCFRFMASAELAMHNNAYRAWCQRGKHDREILPSNAIYSFTSSLEEPMLSEGFAEIRQVNFHFEGEEEDIKRWCRWMQ